MATAVTETHIINGLMSDEHFPAWSDVGMVVQAVTRLPQIVGPDRIAAKVTYTGIMQMQVDLLFAVLQTDFADHDPTGHIRKILQGNCAGFYQLIRKHGHLYDQYEPVKQDSFRFSAEVRQRYNAGILTFADLLRLQPGVFIPKLNPLREAMLPGCEPLD